MCFAETSLQTITVFDVDIKFTVTSETAPLFLLKLTCHICCTVKILRIKMYVRYSTDYKKVEENDKIRKTRGLLDNIQEIKAKFKPR